MEWDLPEAGPGPEGDPFQAPTSASGMAGIMFPMEEVAKKPIQVTGLDQTRGLLFILPHGPTVGLGMVPAPG